MATEVLSAEEVQVADLADQLIAQHPPASTPAIAFLGAQPGGVPDGRQPDIDMVGLGLHRSSRKLLTKRLRAQADQIRTRETQLATACVAQQLWNGELTNKSANTFARCSQVKKFGASCSPSRVRVQTLQVYLQRV